MDYGDLKGQDAVQLGPMGAAVFGGVLVLVGVLLVFVWGGRSLDEGSESESWPTVEGKVTATRIDRRGGRNRIEDKRRYTPRVSYEYVVDGKTHRSDRIDFLPDGHSTRDRSAAEAVLQRYSKGSTVEVFYDPADPSTSCLEPGVKLGISFLAGIGTMGLGLVVIATAAYNLVTGGGSPEPDGGPHVA